jgi:hypothetical protein
MIKKSWKVIQKLSKKKKTPKGRFEPKPFPMESAATASDKLRD